MLVTNRVHAALPAHDLERAKRFYTETLGLEPTDERAEGVTFDCGDGSAVFVFRSSIEQRAGHTQAGFDVPDLDAAVAELRSRGVAFEDVDTTELVTVDGIAVTPLGKAAWFKDSEGNLLGLVQSSRG